MLLPITKTALAKWFTEILDSADELDELDQVHNALTDLDNRINADYSIHVTDTIDDSDVRLDAQKDDSL